MTVSLGYFQRYDDAVDSEIIDPDEVCVIRRMSGGGTIVTDANQIIFCTVLEMNENWRSLIKNACECIITALEDFGINASYKAVNDVEVNGRKISGSGQIIRNGNLAVQSTLLLKQPDVRVLKNNKRSGSLTSVYDLLGYVPEVSTIKKSIFNAVSDKFHEEMYDSEFSAEEKAAVERLVKTKYSLDSYTFKR